MKIWDSYKERVANTDIDAAKILEESENMAQIVNAMIKRRADLCL